MSDKAFRNFMARINQIGQVMQLHNPLNEDMETRITFDAGGEAIIKLPPGSSFRMVLTAYDTECHLEKPAQAKTLGEVDQPNR